MRGSKARLETLAQVGPHSRRKSLAPGGGIFKKQKKTTIWQSLIFIIQGNP